MNVRTIGVLGAGTMGHGIAHAAIAGGYTTRLFDVSPEALENGRAAIDAVITKALELGKTTISDADAMRARLTTHSTLPAALEEVDFIIEAAPERIDLKLALMADIDRLASPAAIVTTNTSALSITEIAGALARPARVAGMHFFNPVHRMKLVEIVQALESGPDALATIADVAQRMGKETVLVRESPGFVTSRINAMIGNEAFYMLQEGVASARDIDTAMRLGYGHPMGPLELSDLVGLDVRHNVSQYLHSTLGG